MQREQVVAAIRESSLAAYADYLEALLRPAVEIVRSQAAVAPGCSKFGGHPDLPAGFVWPQHALGPYRFFAQIDFAELAEPVGGLPRSGLLSLFYAEDENGESFWGDPGYVRAEFFPAGTALTATAPPAVVDLGRSWRIEFRATWDLPYDREQMPDCPLDEEAQDELQFEFRPTLHGTDYLLGYPSHCSLGYDPTPGPAWQSLLTLASYEKLAWCWHDGDRLMVFIETERLKAGDFGDLKADAG